LVNSVNSDLFHLPVLVVHLICRQIFTDCVCYWCYLLVCRKAYYWQLLTCFVVLLLNSHVHLC